MNRTILAVSCIVLCNAGLSIAKERPMLVQLTKKGSQGRNARAHGARHGLDEQTKNILNQFFCMIGNFFSILQDPHDTQRVTANVSNILAGAVNIVAEGIKSGDLGLDADEEEIATYVYTIGKRLSPRLLTLTSV